MPVALEPFVSRCTLESTRIAMPTQIRINFRTPSSARFQLRNWSVFVQNEKILFDHLLCYPRSIQPAVADGLNKVWCEAMESTR